MKHIVSLLLFVLLGFNANAQIKTHIEGEVIGRPQSARLYLGPVGIDWRVAQYDTIDIVDGCFSFDLTTDEVVPYELVFEDGYMSGSWCYNIIFSEGGTINLKLFPEDKYDDNVIRGGKENELYYNLLNLMSEELHELGLQADSLERNNLLYTEEAMRIINSLADVKTETQYDSVKAILDNLESEKRLYTPEGFRIVNEYNGMEKMKNDSRMEAIKQNLSFAGYYFVLKEIKKELLYSKTYACSTTTHKAICLSDDLEAVYRMYEETYPDSWYTKKCRSLIAGVQLNNIGQRMFDFTVADESGREHTLYSYLNKGNVTLLDLWASWCGPCRKKSVSMIPLYEKYRDKGFNIVAVARERKNLDAMREAMKRDGYLWPSLVDLNDKYGVWEKLGVPNAGGKMWLLDNDGSILLVDPTPEQIEEILKQR